MSDLPSDSSARPALAARYREVRSRSEELCTTLEPEDYQLQSMPDCSPPKWHLAHSAWFFETFLLVPHAPGYRVHHPRYGFLFNSYYDSIGDRWARPARGLLSRPTVAEVYAYRRAVDEGMLGLIESADDQVLGVIAPLVEIGLNHEEQHQELLLTDLKHAFGLNPLRPCYAPAVDVEAVDPSPLGWEPHQGGVRWIGHEGPGFTFDNEGPRHREYVAAFALASRPVNNGEYLAFIEDGGYDRPELWLSDGWAAGRDAGWSAPLHWHRDGPGHVLFTLRGMRPLDPAETVCHLSYYEADAYARWAGARLPTEAEWETASRSRPVEGNFLDSGRLHPTTAGGSFYGDVWVWTSSPYAAYRGYRPAAGALGEYNGKFMCNQMVLRGGSCVTPPGHVRPTYRNFFPPHARWQFSGLRLAKDLSE
ncbi:ergothioneine biosynthesis protein EgtB [Planctomyces sp. SH-PL62]|uniref:ergothioneine biosynthesis protein EgtB n=1 Tax=Planctomyces sp. SH-PL62 TaxID=1636152 RepID=UPI00078B9F21|nr:ergothioneine biosynthesis protein EgtB [Planctomyces sp. SH-PL62]AMV35842.1 Iron(II)-dependent oxidoreductase EgtB [Planctomyces sp. SH-PL62]